ncbi:hypothetical protein L208DRAFT_1520376, partial [Tricholoma matsutake]
PLVLILDVKTRCSSTHQMMHKFSLFHTEIDNFVGHHCDLCALELAEDEWVTVAQVADWLKAFWSATMQMLTSKQPMLSMMHAIFRGLQEHIRQIYRNLPTSIAPKIKAGLLDAHWKLSDYYYKYDQSPFYIWAALLDPCISYEGALADDPKLLEYLDSAKLSLHAHYNEHYLPCEDFDMCKPLQWWVGHQAQFLNLYHASLQPETICMLMLVKQRMRLSHVAVDKVL